MFQQFLRKSLSLSWGHDVVKNIEQPGMTRGITVIRVYSDGQCVTAGDSNFSEVELDTLCFFPKIDTDVR